jgi:hypothetical protein
MFSMRSPALSSLQLLSQPLSSRHPPLMTAEEAQATLGFGSAERILPLGVPALDAALPQQGLVLGRVIELQVQGPSGAATSFASCACRAAQRANLSENLPDDGVLQSAVRQGQGERNWCAFIDPFRPRIGSPRHRPESAFGCSPQYGICGAGCSPHCRSKYCCPRSYRLARCFERPVE